MNLDACAWWHMWLNVSDIVLPQPDLKPVVIRSVNQIVAEVHRRAANARLHLQPRCRVAHPVPPSGGQHAQRRARPRLGGDGY